MKRTRKQSAATVAKRLAARAAKAQQRLEKDAIRELTRRAVPDAAEVTPVKTGASKRSWYARKVKAGFSLRNSRPRARFILNGGLVPIGRKALIEQLKAHAHVVALQLKEA